MGVAVAHFRMDDVVWDEDLLRRVSPDVFQWILRYVLADAVSVHPLASLAAAS